MSRLTTTPNAAPRWAGYAAALFGLEYTVAKAVMAAREQLGVPGHPAPPEAYERFTGDVVLAQLGNAALGLVSVALALALVQHWGRRIPTALLAGGAGVSLISGIAGALVVAASLAGLREDHGQWGVDSLVLGAAPLAAWFVLTVAAVRAARAEALPPRMRELGERARRIVRGAARPGRRAALAAGAACAAYGTLKLHWALGGELLMRDTPLPAHAIRDLLEREPAAVAGHWASVALAVIGIGLAVATVRGERLPRLVTVGLPAVLGGLMILRAGYGAVSDTAVLTGAAAGSEHTARWDLCLWSPFFAVWGLAWSLAALAAWRRTAGRAPGPRLRRGRLVRVGYATVAWGVLFAAAVVQRRADAGAGARRGDRRRRTGRAECGARARQGARGARKRRSAGARGADPRARR